MQYTARASSDHSRVHRHASDTTVETAEDDTPDVVPHHTASSVSAGSSSGPADSLPVVRNLFDWLQSAFADAD